MAHDFKKFPELTNSQMDIHYFESPHEQIFENFHAKVVKVTDGDTIRVLWDRRNFDFPVRLIDINAPEMGEGGEESQSWLERQILGKDVEILINPDMLPRLPIFIISPSLLGFVGSPTIQKSIFSLFFFK